MTRRSALLLVLAVAGCASTPRPGPTAQAPAPAAPAAAAAPASPAAAPAPVVEVRELSGRFGHVRLLRAFRIEDDDARLYGAPSGLGFAFLVVRPPGVEGHFTLRELRDVTLSGNSYREVTRKTLGGVYEPQSIINDPSAVRLADGRSVADSLGVSGDEASVMQTFLYGVRIRGAGPIVVAVELGFGDTDALTFTVPLETLPTEPASY